MNNSQFVSNNTHIDLFIWWYFLLKKRLYKPAIHKFQTKDVKNPDTINNNGSIGLFQVSSVTAHHTAFKMMNSNHAIIHHTTSHINIFPKISHPDDWSGFSVKVAAILYHLDL